jgi:S1-C subfamily serine protease
MNLIKRTLYKLTRLTLTGLLVVLLLMIFTYSSEAIKFIRNTYVSKNVFFLSIDSDAEAGGTGFVINFNNNQYIITNWHVCRSSPNNILYKGSEPLKILDFDVDNDLCVLGMSKEKFSGLYINPKESHKHQVVFYIGYPFGENKGFREGTVISKAKSSMIIFNINTDFDLVSCVIEGGSPDYYGCIKEIEYLDSTMLGGPGSSGSPTLNSMGLVVGVIQNYKADKNNNAGFIDAKHLKKLLERLENERRND